MGRILVPFIFTIAALVIATENTESHSASSNDGRPLEPTQSKTQPSGVTVIQVSYYAKPGKAGEVLSHRQHASDVLAKLGLPRGRVMRRAGGSGEQPDVLWECEFPNAAALEQFLKAASASSEFDAVRKYMATLIRNAERRDWEVQETPR
jgi:hypothetical protein